VCVVFWWDEEAYIYGQTYVDGRQGQYASIHYLVAFQSAQDQAATPDQAKNDTIKSDI